MNILVIAPHNDDEVLGVGGTIAKLVDQGHLVYVCEVTSGRNIEHLREEALNAHQVLGISKTFFLGIPVNSLRTSKQTIINEKISEIVKAVSPEMVFLPHIGDIHTDHKETASAAMIALRTVNAPFVKKILAYETLSETGWDTPNVVNEFIPTLWSDITDYIDVKLKAMSAYQSQLHDYPHPRSIQAVRNQAAYRGNTVNKEYAEAFVVIREII